MEELAMDAKEDSDEDLEPKTKLRSRRKKKDTSNLETLEPQDAPAEKVEDADPSTEEDTSDEATIEDSASEEKA
jgi:hypothetical protein